MRRGAKPAKAKVEAKPPAARKSGKNEDPTVHDLEKRLAEALGREAEALKREAEVQRREAESLEQQTATAEILQVIASSPTDALPTFQAIASAATRLCSARDTGVIRFDGTLLHLMANEGFTTEERDALRAQFPRPADRTTVTGRAILTRAVAHVADITQDSDYGVPTLLFMRAVLSVPMLRDGQPIGAITITRHEAKPFSPSQIALLETFADQAVIAIENVRLFRELQSSNAELRIALEQQTATSEILSVISSSPTDVQPVFDAIVRSAVRLCHAAFGGLHRVDGEMNTRAAVHNIPDDELAMLRGMFPRPIRRDTLSSRAILDRCVVHIPDIREDAEYNAAVRNPQADRGYRTALAVPMLREGAPIGAIVLWRREVLPFTDKQIEMVQTFADQAVIAIENVRLFKELEARNTELRVALEQQTATSEILRVISSSPTDVQPVFDAIVTSSVRLCGAAYGSFHRFDGELLHLETIHNVPPERWAELARRFPHRAGPDTAVGLAVVERRVVRIDDVLDEPSTPRRETAREVLGYRAWLSVPVLRGDQALGVISIWRPEPGSFTDAQIELLKTFADQAVIAIENVRLFKELQARNRDLAEALEQQTATSEILGVISSSPTDVQPVFDAIARSAMRLCEGTQGFVTRFDGELMHAAAFAHLDPGAVEQLQQRFPMRPSRASMHGRAILEGGVVHISDVLADAEYDQFLSQAVRHRSGLVVPMLRDGRPVGTIGVSREQVRPFTDTQIALLQTFADQAIIAIENVRLFTELQARTNQLTRSVQEWQALSEVGRAVSSTLDLETVLTTIVSRAVDLSGLDGGVVSEYDETAEEFVQQAVAETGGVLAQALRGVRYQKGEGAIGRTAITREPVQVPDITVPGAYDSRVRENLIESGIRAVLAVPMIHQNRLIGCLGVTRKRTGEFPAETIELLRTFATQSALAIQNARLFREIEIKSRQLEAASQHKSEFLANMSHELRTPLNAIIGFSEVLSERMFGDLNEKQDEYLKDIYASGTHLLSLINDILDLSKIEAGRMELELTDFDLPQAIDDALILVRERAGRRGIALHQSVEEHLGEIRADERKIKQVLLNLLSNALKFTPEGGRVDLLARVVDGMAEISVTDTGVGIAPEDQEAVFEEFRQVGTAEKKAEGTGLGLTLCWKFIELHGGRIWVTSQVGVGSTFTFTIPVRSGK